MFIVVIIDKDNIFPRVDCVGPFPEEELAVQWKKDREYDGATYQVVKLDKPYEPSPENEHS